MGEESGDDILSAKTDYEELMILSRKSSRFRDSKISIIESGSIEEEDNAEEEDDEDD